MKKVSWIVSRIWEKKQYAIAAARGLTIKATTNDDDNAAWGSWEMYLQPLLTKI